MSDLRDLLARTLAAQGALVEPIDPEGLEICAPPEVQEALSLPEWCRVGFGAVLPEQAVRISFESDWAQRLMDMLGRRGTYVTLELGPKETRAPEADLERDLARTLILENATYRLQEIVPSASVYFLLVYHLTSTSDDKREEIIHLCLNESNGAMANHWVGALLARLREDGAAPAAEPVQAELPLAFSGQRVRELAERMLPPLVRGRLAPFVAGMERRMARDLERLHAYYSDLRAEAATWLEDRKRRGDDKEVLDGGRARIEAIEREYHAKVADLHRKYAMTVEVRLMQALRVRLPVYRAHIALLRRKGVRKLHLDWSVPFKGFDLMPCEACGAAAKVYSVCDDRLHCLCPSCLSGCPACARECCRACHPRKCPRCGQPWGSGPAGPFSDGIGDAAGRI